MGYRTYPAAIAVQFVAIGRLQGLTSSAKNQYVEDRLLRATDAIVNRRHDHHISIFLVGSPKTQSRRPSQQSRKMLLDWSERWCLPART